MLARGAMYLGCLAALALLPACPVNSSTSDGPVSDASDDGLVTLPPLRDVTFNGLSPGEFTGGTINSLTFQVGPFNGNQLVLLQNMTGEGQDLVLECGTVTIRAPENHLEMGVVFNDVGQSLQI